MLCKEIFIFFVCVTCCWTKSQRGLCGIVTDEHANSSIYCRLVQKENYFEKNNGFWKQDSYQKALFFYIQKIITLLEFIRYYNLNWSWNFKSLDFESHNNTTESWNISKLLLFPVLTMLKMLSDRCDIMEMLIGRFFLKPICACRTLLQFWILLHCTHHYSWLITCECLSTSRMLFLSVCCIYLICSLIHEVPFMQSLSNFFILFIHSDRVLGDQMLHNLGASRGCKLTACWPVND